MALFCSPERRSDPRDGGSGHVAGSAARPHAPRERCPYDLRRRGRTRGTTGPHAPWDALQLDSPPGLGLTTLSQERANADAHKCPQKAQMGRRTGTPPRRLPPKRDLARCPGPVPSAQFAFLPPFVLHLRFQFLASRGSRHTARVPGNSAFLVPAKRQNPSKACDALAIPARNRLILADFSCDRA